MEKGNFYLTPEGKKGQEIIEKLLETQAMWIERITSFGSSTPEGVWYDQDTDEWVLLLKGSAQLEFEDGSILDLNEGDWVFIPAGEKHRVTYTSFAPSCLWLAIHMRKPGGRP